MHGIEIKLKVNLKLYFMVGSTLNYKSHKIELNIIVNLNGKFLLRGGMNF